jgi:LemA protein
MDSTIPVAVALGAFLVWALLIWNRLVRLKGAVTAQLGAVDAEARRLCDLVPGLEEATRASVAHERETLHAVIAAREAVLAQAATPPDPFTDPGLLAARAGAGAALSSTVNRLLAQAEAHPDLKDNESLHRLAREATVGADRLAAARRSYNQAVTSYNAALQAFPAAMFAHTLGFRAAAPLG